MSATTSELPAYLESLGVKFSHKPTEHPKTAPKWAAGFAAYRVTITHNKKRASFTFYKGKGAGDITAADLVFDLARNYDLSCLTLQEFGDELGWDSQTAATHKAVKRHGERFKRLFPENEIRQNIAEMEY
jgi:hypothetical protein